MSLNWKEINLILEELELEGSQIQKAVQSAYDVISLKIFGRGGAKNLLVSLSPGACRLHETFKSTPKSDKPLRFAQFLNSRVANGRIEEAVQIGANRIIRIKVRIGAPEEHRLLIYIRLWSNAANVIVTDENGLILDAMKRLPNKGEITGGHYSLPPDTPVNREYGIRDFPDEITAELPAGASFNRKIDAWYGRQGGAISLDSLREEAKKKYENSIDRIKASLEKLRAREADFGEAERLKEYGDIILANIGTIKPGDQWLEAVNFYAAQGEESLIRIKLDARKSPQAAAENYYEQYRKAKSGIAEVRAEIERGERELAGLEKTLNGLLDETNPLNLYKQLKTPKPGQRNDDAKRPGLSFRRNDWLSIVGRDASENDELLRRHVNGNDLWLHARDFPGSYVFIKQRSGKTVPLDILLDAGHLAIFYSKGRNNGAGDLFYTQVKYLRRAKNAPKGTVLPTQEKNLHIKMEDQRLRELEECRV